MYKNEVLNAIYFEQSVLERFLLVESILLRYLLNLQVATVITSAPWGVINTSCSNCAHLINRTMRNRQGHIGYISTVERI